MKLSAMGAIELQRAIDHADGSEDTGTALFRALQEVQRLRTICQDIIDVIGVDYTQGAEPNFCLYQIAEIAQRYFKP